LTNLDDFSTLILGIQNHLCKDVKSLDVYCQYYEEALDFMELVYILPKNEFTTKRMNLIGRNLALTIYFSIYNMCDEAQILLRQILDLIYIILYGANHVLELDLIDKGKIDLIGNIKSDINKRLPKKELRSYVNNLYRNLSCVVHGTVENILSQVAILSENWNSPNKFSHWKRNFHQTLEYSLCLSRSWFPNEYAMLDTSTRARFEKKYPSLIKFFS